MRRLFQQKRTASQSTRTGHRSLVERTAGDRSPGADSEPKARLRKVVDLALATPLEERKGNRCERNMHEGQGHNASLDVCRGSCLSLGPGGHRKCIVAAPLRRLSAD